MKMRILAFKSLFYLGSVIISIVAVISILFAGLFTFSALPPFVQDEVSLIYGSDGSVIARVFVENREIVSLTDISPHLPTAIIATEDARFYRHRGIDFIGLVRAILEDIRRRSLAQGASTITQQLARNLFGLGMEKTFTRKLHEAWLALQLERHYSKQEILELYVNEIYLGHGVYGVEAASKLYFGKSASDLNLAESAMLAGIIRGPEVYSPRVNLDRAKTRQAWVLERMVTVGAISREQADAAKDTPLAIVKGGPQQSGGGYLRDIVRRILDERLEGGAALLATAGLRVYTSIDPQAQSAAEAAVARLAVSRTDSTGIPQPQVALVALDAITGEVRAWVGGRATTSPQFNRVVDAMRSPGSSFKPFLYVTALEQGLTASTLVECEQTTFSLPTGQQWTPTDFGEKYHERPLTLREAVVVSCNVVAARLIDRLTPQSVIDTARRMGMKTELNPVLSLALGTSETNALNMAAAFTPLANGGKTIVREVGNPILRVEDRRGRVLLESKPVLAPGGVDPRVAYIMTDIMRGVLVPPGTGLRASGIFARPAAGKTGTSEDYRDAWFVGYTPQLVCAVYVGDDDNLSLGGTGGGLATPVWAEFMRDTHKALPVQNFARPEGIEDVTICSSSWLIAREECPAELRRTELYVAGTAPQEACTVHEPQPFFPWPWNWFRNDANPQPDSEVPDPDGEMLTENVEDDSAEETIEEAIEESPEDDLTEEESTDEHGP